MATLIETISKGRKVESHRPWPRFTVDAGTWNAVAARLADGQATLAGLWGADDDVHMAVVDAADKALAVVSLDCPQGTFPSVGRVHPPAIRLERAIADLFGLLPEGAPDARPWLDHGRWGVRHPLGRRVDVADAPVDYPFLAAEGESLHQIPVGPVHAGIIEPGHFRFTANGETVVRLEERLGYVHKGIEALAAGADIAHAAKLAGRTSGDSTVAYTLAYARAVEAALSVAVTPRAVWLRALMAELERLANHFGDVGAVCNDAAFTLAHAHFGILRESVLRVADDCFGHRLMRDCVVPGGVAIGLDDEGAASIRVLVAELGRRFPALVELYDNTASVKDRTFGTGVLSQALARQFGAGGFVGRASGRDVDARRWPGYPPYDELEFKVPVLSTGDVNARVWVRIQEIDQSLSLIGQILDRLPAGAARVEVPRGSGEGLGLVEGFRGDILVWVRLGGGRVERCHLRDPSWFQWPLLEAVIEGNIVADFPLCNKSFNCSYSGHDL
ncbi:MAG: NADH-quinone oxidoreductase subunit C [Rhodospirillales bacterium]|nr:NADH-quinone oxidoreductase subunit C [Rhodospirillales bacterium]